MPIAKKRGRKPKLVAPIDISNPLGRPPLARNALENDIEIGVVLRRSNRIPVNVLKRSQTVENAHKTIENGQKR